MRETYRQICDHLERDSASPAPALDFLLSAVERLGAESWVVEALGRLAARSGRYADSYAALKIIAVEAGNSNWALMNLMGEQAVSLGLIEAAREHYRAALSLQPDHVETLQALIALLQDPESAAERMALIQVLLRQPMAQAEAAELWQEAAELHLRAGDLDTGLVAVREALAAGGVKRSLFTAFIEQLDALGRHEDRIALLRLKVDYAGSPQAAVAERTELARAIFDALGDGDAARDVLTPVVEDAAGLAPYWQLLVQCCEHSERWMRYGAGPLGSCLMLRGAAAADVLLRLARLHIDRLDDSSACESALHDARACGSLGQDALREYADLALRSGASELAIGALDVLMEKAVKEEEIVRYGLSKVTLLEESMARPDQALRSLRALSVKCSRSIKVSMRLAEAELALGDEAKGIVLIEQLLKSARLLSRREHARLRFLRGRHAFHRNEWQLARQHLRVADDLREGDEATLGLLRDVSFRLNQLREACQYGQSLPKGRCAAFTNQTRRRALPYWGGFCSIGHGQSSATTL